jgi:D-sedoheptulose 7-phosphate isomerase
MELFADTLIDERTIFWCGNGGSASESSHLAAELIGRFKNNRKPFPSISLASDLSVITCIANDFGYKEIFSRQLEGLAKKTIYWWFYQLLGIVKIFCKPL